MTTNEMLPPGVGRIPKWWMELTPHFVYDPEEEEARRMAEYQMTQYYSEMAKADDAGMLDENGNPILGPDGKPQWNGLNGWAGRSSSGAGGGGPVDGPLGPNFVPGQVTPESLRLLGIDESDPDYHSYLSGAKLPKGYWDKLAELGYTGPGFTANNLQQTDFGRYGRQAEQPAFKPAWMKVRLKSTSHGSAIRKGEYDDSPEKRNLRRIQDATPQDPASAIAAPPLQDDVPSQPTPAKPTPIEQQAAEEQPKMRLVRKVRKVRRKKRQPNGEVEPEAVKPTPAPAPPAPPAHVPAPPAAPAVPFEPATFYPKYTHKDYYYNAPANQAHAGAPRSSPQPLPNTPVSPPRQQHAPVSHPVHQEAPLSPSEYEEVSMHEEDEMEEYEEKTYDGEFGYNEETEYEEEELVEDDYDGYDDEYDDHDHGHLSADANLQDLQAILAAKQAELARLQSM